MINLASSLTVSGISSGGFMAAQFQVAFSASVNGSGIFAGGPYYCSQGIVSIATTACMTSPELLNVDKLVQDTKNFAEKGTIDSILNLANRKIWIFSGILDTVVVQGVVKKTGEFFSNFVSPSNLQSTFSIPSEHSWVTNNFGNLCSYLGTPFINICGFDGSGSLLLHLYNSLSPKVKSSESNLHTFLQSKYGDITLAGLLPIGFIYIPSTCERSKCEVHVSFHGCLQSSEFISDVFVKNNGLNDWAESNSIVVLYPQVLSSFSNPQGCWDFWGYSGKDFAFKTGRQMRIVYAMTQNVPGVSW
jgi:hypothetical protein